MKLLPVLAVIYVISPLDLVPDIAPIIGWLDDVGVLGVVVGLVWRALQKHVRELPEPPAPAPDPQSKDPR